MKETLATFFYDYFIKFHIPETLALYLNLLAMIVILLLLLYVIDRITRRVLISLFSRFSSSTKTNFDDILLSHHVPRNLAHIIPFIVALKFVPVVFYHFDDANHFFLRALLVLGIIMVLWIVRSILQSLNSYFKTLPRLRDKPIDSYIQVFMIFAWFSGIIFALAVVSGIDVWRFLTGLGAISAVILLIFKDTILGFVASIQVAINDMVRIGDWITFEKFEADGDVIEINLSTVKVQNFDKTITTIPTYALISDSFKNWRGMTTSGGRRIKRHMLIKQSSIKYLTDADIERLKEIQLISDYVAQRQDKIKSYNTDNNINKELLLNGRNLTNIGVFRKYIQTSLENHPALNKEMIAMARQLQPTTQGIPLEIYAFSSDKRWKNYEYIMSDLFDHFLAAVPYFDLELFELPSSHGSKKMGPRTDDAKDDFSEDKTNAEAVDKENTRDNKKERKNTKKETDKGLDYNNLNPQ
ncbi:mechanosensitive ion channel [Bizionia gelidisalsuginis]|uniref:Mechanosensitive ion channel n=2 Tax=Bizionia TaxID=283785 RepID=A0A8H2LN76_9FLAO|nr:MULTISPECIES: mechanosensitive ion channel domain-containing protein [Bizionia]TYB76639.1 mechanosensitive ion channel [Bizionia saleffrena]TYC14168.1 mechanosensitive ion channel [Bizionia gelidisalsuginis]